MKTLCVTLAQSHQGVWSAVAIPPQTIEFQRRQLRQLQADWPDGTNPHFARVVIFSSSRGVEKQARFRPPAARIAQAPPATPENLEPIETPTPRRKRTS